MSYECDEDKGRELESEGAAISDKGARKGVKHVHVLGKIRHKELQVECHAVGSVFGVTGVAGRKQNKAAGEAGHLDVGILTRVWLVSW